MTLLKSKLTLPAPVSTWHEPAEADAHAAGVGVRSTVDTRSVALAMTDGLDATEELNAICRLHNGGIKFTTKNEEAPETTV